MESATVYCLLVNRVQFLREQSAFGRHQSVNLTRAAFCELVANRVLRRFDEDNPGAKGLLLLANILVAGFEPFQNAPPEVIEDNEHAIRWTTQRRGGYERKLTALEIAIISESKLFLSSTATQKVVDAIYRGLIVYTPTSFIDIIPDHYKHKAISLYDPKKEKLLNQYRLIVPRTRNIVEVVQFILLLVLYFVLMTNRNDDRFMASEAVFCVYCSGWVLDQLASILEHGFQVYTQNLWSFLDATFIVIFEIYLFVRIYGCVGDHAEARSQALDILSMGAPVLIPRLAFNLMSENMLFVSLRAMMADFTLLTVLAIWCFGGFLLGMKWLSKSAGHEYITIGKWMLWIWFGLDGTGIQRCVDFHWLLGPVLMVTYAFLGNTLFLTVLVAMLSTTFSNIVANATAEIQFRRAVLTFMGVKSDAIFAYPPPFNIVALIVLIPMKFVLSPRWFHKINVVAVRVINAPFLLLITLYERRCLWITHKGAAPKPSKPRGRTKFWGVQRFSVHGDIQAVFEGDPPKSILEEIEEETEGGHHRQSTTSFLDAEYAIRHGSRADASPHKLSDRKGSVISGVAGHINELLQEHGFAGKDVKERLVAVEQGMRRLEELLGKLVEVGDGDGDPEEGGAGPEEVASPTDMDEDIKD
jgi:hypothetical protein